MTCPSFDEVIKHRLEQNGEKITLANGKLIERLLTLKKAREGIVQNPDEIYFTWDWDAHPDGPDETNHEPKTDESKAPFLKHLVELAEEKISKIR